MTESPFLQVPRERWVASNDLAFAFPDSFPVSPGHTLVVTKRLVPSWFDATSEEQAALMSLVNDVKRLLDATLRPKADGYNVGFNSGRAAGQTVMHVHVHVIPRYRGDMPDPRGGVRHVIPEKGNYLLDGWQTAAAGPTEEGRMADGLRLSTGHPQSRLWDPLSDRLAGARMVDVLASFVQLSGLDVIEKRLFEVLRREAAVRIAVSDYLFISDPRALWRFLHWRQAVAEDDAFPGSLEVRLIETRRLEASPESFHPKAWRILDDVGAFVVVGSSNLSRPALVSGVEWNLLHASRDRDGLADAFGREFDRLWDGATGLSPEVIGRYEEAWQSFRSRRSEPERVDDREIPEPRPWQQAALESLERIREGGCRRALVAVATGMGKTWLAAFDACRVGERLGRRPRVLVIAHRSHILAQAESALSRILEERFGQGSTTWYRGSRSDLGGELVIASVQKLARPEGLERLADEAFDYVIVDEVHHAHAPTYRRVLARLGGGFVLGLTATPERGDGVDVASIFDDNLAHHATIGDGIAEDSLVPFHYIGIKDSVDFRQIPWRNGRFDPAELERRVEQSERSDRLWRAMQEHPAGRTIVFCCSRRHALFTRNWLRSRGVEAAAVFSGEGGDNYGESLARLRGGELRMLCVVDMFNEGLDIPAVDRVIMLRPTESKVIFLQQLGRGLRAADGKTRLVVIDFVGNHRIFAQRIVHLLSLGGEDADWRSLKAWLGGEPPRLPAGCLLDVELEAQDMLKEFIPTGSRAALETYRAMRDELGRRPSAAELLAHGILPRTLSTQAGSWFGFVDEEGDLTEDQKKVVDRYLPWLKTLETTNLNKSYKMVVLRVLLAQGRLFDGVDLFALAAACRRSMWQHPVLRRDLTEGRHAIDHRRAGDDEWAKWWIRWPIDRWLDAQNGHRWFTRNGDTFAFAAECPEELRPTLESMTEELVDWRLAHYCQRNRPRGGGADALAFEAKVSHAGGRPILFLPARSELPDRPVGPVRVRLPEGDEWEFRFVKIACNVAKPKGVTKNQLPQLLQRWFGAHAGLPGTDFKVRFVCQQGQWHVRPISIADAPRAGESAADSVGSVDHGTESPIEPPGGWEGAEEQRRDGPAENDVTLRLEHSVGPEARYTTHVPVHDLMVAAGDWGEQRVPEAIGWLEVAGHRLREGMFVARVVGRSMEPRIPSGAWCLFAPCPAGSRQNRLVLVQIHTHLDPEEGGRFTVKRYHSTKRETEDGWEHESIELRPINPEFPPIPIGPDQAEDVRILAEFQGIVS